MLKSALAVLLLASFTVPAFARDHQMLTARVISQDLNSYNAGVYGAPIGNAVVAVPIQRRSNVVVIESKKYRITMTEVGNKTLIVPVNDTISFYQDGRFVILLDAQQKKHKFAVTNLVSLTPTAQ